MNAPGGSGTTYVNYVTPTDTDYQVVSMTLGSLNLLGGGSTENTLIGRANSAMTTMVYFAMYDGTGYLFARVAGVNTVLKSIPYTPVVGDYQLECGNPETSTLLEFNVFCNGIPILSCIDSGAVSQYGASNRLSGFWMTSAGAGDYPASVSSWGVYDNPPAAVVGSVFRQYTASTTPTAAIGSGAQLLPNSFFDTNQWISADYTSTPGNNNELQVSVSGVYSVTIVLMVDYRGSGIHSVPLSQRQHGSAWPAHSHERSGGREFYGVHLYGCLFSRRHLAAWRLLGGRNQHVLRRKHRNLLLLGSWVYEQRDNIMKDSQ